MIQYPDPSRLKPAVLDQVIRIGEVLREHRGRPVRLQVIVDRVREQSLIACNKTHVCRSINVLRKHFGFEVSRGYYGVKLENEPPAMDNAMTLDPFAALENLD